MRIEDLKEYLGIVVDMEQNIFLQTNLLQSIGKEIEKMKIPGKFDEPTKPAASSTQPKYVMPHSILGIILGAIGLFFLVFLVIMFFEYYILNPIEGQYNSRKEMNEMWYILAFIIPIVWAAICIAENINTFQKNEKERMVSEAEYQDAMVKYQANIIEVQQRRQQVEANRQTQLVFLQNQQTQIAKHLVEAKNCLQKIYTRGIIFPKYRNLAMVCSLYEYICAGRCNTLEGHEGAYNILEAEIRLDRIISQLDQVISHLEQIKQNQFMLYSAIQNTNQQLGQIMGSISDISASLNGLYNSTSQLNTNVTQLNARIAELQASSALTAYHAERMQKELAYMNRMDYLSGRNDDVFFNHPPV